MQHKFPSRIRILALVLVVILALAAVNPVTFAQGTLSAEEQALLDRAVAAVGASEEYTSYMVEIEQSEETYLYMEIPEVFTQESTTSQELEAEGTIILGDNPNASLTAHASYESDEDGAPVSYEIEAEVRYVDGTTYVNASYASSEGDVPALAEGWMAVDDPDMYPEFDVLDLDGLIDEMTDEGGFSEEFAKVSEFITSVSVEQEEMDDGTVVDVIFFTLGWDGLVAVLEEEDEALDPEDPMTAIFAEQLAGNDEIVTLAVAVDSDDRAHGVALLLEMELTGVDLAALDPSLPEGSTISLTLSMSEIVTYSDINGTFEPVAAP